MKIFILIRGHQQAGIINQILLAAYFPCEGMTRSDKYPIVRNKKRNKYQAVIFGQPVNLMSEKQIDMIAEQQIEQAQMVADFNVDGAGWIGLLITGGDRLQYRLPPRMSGAHV